MCAINGMTRVDREFVTGMNARTMHRGPDGGDVVAHAHAQAPVTIGHRLLSLRGSVELGAQPIMVDNGRHILAYNGEIYNCDALQNMLAAKGVTVSAQCDTQILAKGLEIFGIDFVAHLDGMFAFAWYCQETQKLWLARDASGIKPLYYCFDRDGALAFSSEIRGLSPLFSKNDLNDAALKTYLQLGYTIPPHTLWNGVSKLAPGQVIAFDYKNKKLETHYYSEQRTPYAPQGDHVKAIGETLEASLQAAIVGYRPLGLYLSGGLDSSICLALLHRLGFTPHLLTTRFETSLPRAQDIYNDDALHAERYAKELGLPITVLTVTERDFVDEIGKTAAILEEPIYNRSSPAYYLANKAMHALGAVITASGDGGDELFMGYNKYKIAQHCLPTQHHDAKTLAASWLGVNYQANFTDNNQQFEKLVTIYRQNHPHPNDVVNMHALLDQKLWMAEDVMTRNDKLSMHFGMEGRFPLMLKGLRHLAEAIPAATKMQSTTKSLLREVCMAYLPEYLRNKRKTGWASPTEIWRQNKYGAFSTYLQDTKTRKYGKWLMQNAAYEQACQTPFNKKTIYYTNSLLGALEAHG
ncbi:MAG: asparagine synthase (glutamine-hydrolyzing) [Pseudomonadota bacterium]